MNPKLRPHLYPDLLGMFKMCIRAPVLCNFALSSRDAYFTVVRRLIAPYKHDVTDEYYYDDRHYYFSNITYLGSILHPTVNDLMFEFTEEYNIPTLLRLSGRHIENTAFECPPKESWNVPFYEGVSENECLSILEAYAGRSFVEAYVCNRDTLNHVIVRQLDDHVADLLENKTIRTLTAEPIDVEDGIEVTRELNVESLELENINGSYEKMFAFQNDSFKYRANLETLKKVEFQRSMGCRTVESTLQKWQNIKEFVFNEVSGCRCYRDLDGYEELVEYMNDHTNDLWKAMLKFPGKVTVKYRPYVHARYSAKKVADLFRRKGSFKVSENGKNVFLYVEMAAIGQTTKHLEVVGHLSLM